MLDNRVQGLEDALSNTYKTVEEIEHGLNALDTTVNEARLPGKNLKWTVNRNVKSWRTSSCMQKFILEANLWFYGICEEGDQEDTYTTLKAFMEHHLGIKSEEFAEIELQLGSLKKTAVQDRLLSPFPSARRQRVCIL